jgi:crotonobetainyl-CoA:carnitine CoA-transferase CaiB-like acyl-CoA transferase
VTAAPETDDQLPPGPLTGLRVLDLTALLPGPLASLMLADYGADVIKVEAPSRPDGERSNPPFTQQGGSYRFGMLNRNKRAFAVDLKTEDGREALLRLIDTADVLLEGFRPGVTDRLGIGYDAVSARNPRIVYCSLSGYGQDGPYALLPGHDLNYLAATGITTYLGTPSASPDQPIRPPWIPIADIGGGALMAVFGILTALAGRDATGRGDFVDAAMFDGAFFWQSARLHVFLAEGREPSAADLPSSGGIPAAGIFRTGDDRLLSLCCLEPVFWRNLRAALDLEAELPEVQPTGPDAEPARQLIIRRLRDHDRETWLKVMREHDVPASPALTMSELPDDPHIRARDLLISHDLGDGVGTHIGFPVKMRNHPPSLRHQAPRLGEHTAELLRELGVADDEIDRMMRTGAIA